MILNLLDACEIIYKDVLGFCYTESTEEALQALKPIFSNLEFDDEELMFYAFVLWLGFETSSQTFSIQDVRVILGDSISFFCLADKLEDFLNKFVELNLLICEGKKGEFTINSEVFENVLLDNNKNYKFLDDTKKSKIIIKKTNPLFTVIQPDSIQTEELFYPSDIKDDMNDINQMLKEEIYKKIQKTLQNNSYIQNRGLTVFLSGAPGCGKTSAVYQWARLSGRKIFKVNLSQTKDSYVGESEKLTEKLFSDYENACKSEKKVPILFINECDGLFGKRFSSPECEVDQAQNCIQNIILEKLETQNGILICTSNKLLEDLDPAYKRRFLVNLIIPEFSREDREKIWSEKYHFEVSWARQLSFTELSPGEMQQAMKKKLIKEAILGRPINLEEFMSICKKEKGNAQELNTIGFKKRLCG